MGYYQSVPEEEYTKKLEEKDQTIEFLQNQLEKYQKQPLPIKTCQEDDPKSQKAPDLINTNNDNNTIEKLQNEIKKMKEKSEESSTAFSHIYRENQRLLLETKNHKTSQHSDEAIIVQKLEQKEKEYKEIENTLKTAVQHVESVSIDPSWTYNHFINLLVEDIISLREELKQHKHDNMKIKDSEKNEDLNMKELNEKLQFDIKEIENKYKKFQNNHNRAMDIIKGASNSTSTCYCRFIYHQNKIIGDYQSLFQDIEKHYEQSNKEALLFYNQLKKYEHEPSQSPTPLQKFKLPIYKNNT